MSYYDQFRVRAHVLQDGHVDHVTGPRCMIKPTEGKHNGLYLIAQTDEVLSEGTEVIYDYIYRKATPLHTKNTPTPTRKG